ncbi:MAG: DNA (cytosine-5-)-methyltransferase [Magnetococcus sp. WYHC-3]
MNYIDLFSGIGGFALGAYWAGWRFDKHYFSEIDPWCCKLYQQRFPEAITLGDIEGIDGRRLVSDAKREWEVEYGRKETGGSVENVSSRQCEEWVITGGFPCQDISTAGKGAGITGERSGLWFEYARLIGEIRPRYAIMENVGALTRRGLDRVLGSLAEIGYDAEWSDIRASDVGAPHRRERIWIVAYPHKSQLERRGLSCGENSEHSNTFVKGWWETEPDVGRVAYGIPSWVDRLKGLGNAIVPQIAEMIFRQLRGY